MNPVSKTLLIIFGSLVGILGIPLILVILHEYVLAFTLIFVFLAVLALFVKGMFDELYPELRKKHFEEEEIMHRFHGDKRTIAYYKGFKKYFDGDLSEDGLKKWLSHHV